MSLLNYMTGGRLAARKRRLLAAHVAQATPRDASLLYLSSGDSPVARLLAKRRRDLAVSQLDAQALTGRQGHGGTRLPYPDGAFDVVALVEVLDRCGTDALISEAVRVARFSVIVKDRYPSAAETTGHPAWANAALEVSCDWCVQRLRLWPWPLDLFLQRSEFLARYSVARHDTEQPVPDGHQVAEQLT